MPQVVKLRPWHVALLAAFGLVATLFASYYGFRPGDQAVAREATGPLLERRPLTLLHGVHMLGGLTPSVVYAVETTEGLVLIDAGLQSDAQEVKKELAELHLESQRIRAILLTHAHGDHSGGARALRAATGARVYAGRGDCPVLRAGGPPEAFFSTFHGAPEPPHPTPIDVELTGDEWIHVGDVRIQALSTPGHTPGSMCYLMERDGIRILFSGDVIMSLTGDPHSDSRLAQPLGTYAAYQAPRYRGDARAYLTSLQRLRALPAPNLVLPGHPGMDPTPPSARMSPERWTALLDHGMADMQQLLRRYEQDGANFLDGVPKRLLPGLDYLGERDGRAIYALIAHSRLVLVNAPGGPGLLAFVGSRLHQLEGRPLSPSGVLLTSCTPAAISGLADLGKHPGLRVYAAGPCLAQVRAHAPAGCRVEPATELRRQGWFDLETVASKDAGSQAAAYQVRLAGKTVLITAGILEPPAAGPESRPRRLPLLDQLTAGQLLRQLRRLKPDLWTPERPLDGQNANLYDHDWDEVFRQRGRTLD